MVMLPVRVEADHAGADAGQHRFGEAAASSIWRLAAISSLRWVELCVMRLKAQAQRADLVVVWLDLDLRLEIAFRDALGRADQAEIGRTSRWRPTGRARSRPAG